MAVTSGTGLAGRRALVTGATRGIGAATADLLSAAGARVVVSARSAPADSPHPVVAADLSTAEGAEQAAEQTLAVLGGIDVVVSNAATRATTAAAGGTTRGPGPRTTPATSPPSPAPPRS